MYAVINICDIVIDCYVARRTTVSPFQTISDKYKTVDENRKN